MRFVVAFVLAVMLVSPAWAQNDFAGHNFGRETCRQPVPCPDDLHAYISSSAIASAGSACVTQSFGYVNSKGFFDDIAGLDSSGCLTVIPGVLPKGMNGGQLIPACCVVKAPDGNSCFFRCELNAP